MESVSKTNNMLSQAYNIFSNKFITVLLLTLFFYVPFYIIYYISSSYVEQRYTGVFALNGFDLPQSFVILSIFILFLNSIFSPVFMSSIYLLTNEYSEESKLKFGIIVKRVLKMWPILFITSICFNCLVFASAPLIILTPFVFVFFYFYAFVICEGVKNPLVVLMTTYKSLKGSYLVSFAILLLVSVLNLSIGGILSNLVEATNMPLNIATYIFFNIINTIISAYFYVFLAIWFKGKYDDFLDRGGLNEY